MRNTYLTTGTLVLLTAVSSSDLAQGVPTSSRFDVDQPLPALTHALSATSHLSDASASTKSQSGSGSEEGSYSAPVSSQYYVPETQIQAGPESTYQIPTPSLSNVEVFSEPVDSTVSAESEEPLDESLSGSEDSAPRRRFPSYRWMFNKYVYDEDQTNQADPLQEFDANLNHTNSRAQEHPMTLIAQRLRRAVPSIVAGVKRNPTATAIMKRSNAEDGTERVPLTERRVSEGLGSVL
ncbi:hypothetical protein QCA50_006045 [Cerrena zonata]|uniref:Uncharacterized protein n=1 Tax=Cerrena zonata TaxID=2478898 RepID=A0AAW0GLY7_9APHY